MNVQRDSSTKTTFRGLKLQPQDYRKQMILKAKVSSKINKFVSQRNSPNTDTKCSKDCDEMQVYKYSSDRSSRSEQQIFRKPQDIDHTAKEIENQFYKDYTYKGRHPMPKAP
ncbi:unnamed protein product [Lathyrus oleraceus]